MHPSTPDKGPLTIKVVPPPASGREWNGRVSHGRIMEGLKLKKITTPVPSPMPTPPASPRTLASMGRTFRKKSHDAESIADGFVHHVMPASPTCPKKTNTHQNIDSVAEILLNTPDLSTKMALSILTKYKTQQEVWEAMHGNGPRRQKVEKTRRQSVFHSDSIRFEDVEEALLNREKADMQQRLQQMRAHKDWLDLFTRLFFLAVGAHPAPNLTLGRFKDYIKEVELQNSGVTNMSLEIMFHNLTRPHTVMSLEGFLMSHIIFSDMFYPDELVHNPVEMLINAKLRPYIKRELHPSEDPLVWFTDPKKSRELDALLLRYENALDRLFRQYSKTRVNNIPVNHPHYYKLGGPWDSTISMSMIIEFMKIATVHPRMLKGPQLTRIAKASGYLFPEHPLKKNRDEEILLLQPEFYEMLVRISDVVMRTQASDLPGRVAAFLKEIISRAYVKIFFQPILRDLDIETPKPPIIQQITPSRLMFGRNMQVWLKGLNFCKKRGVYVRIPELDLMTRCPIVETLQVSFYMQRTPNRKENALPTSESMNSLLGGGKSIALAKVKLSKSTHLENSKDFTPTDMGDSDTDEEAEEDDAIFTSFNVHVVTDLEGNMQMTVTKLRQCILEVSNDGYEWTKSCGALTDSITFEKKIPPFVVGRELHIRIQQVYKYFSCEEYPFINSGGWQNLAKVFNLTKAQETEKVFTAHAVPRAHLGAGSEPVLDVDGLAACLAHYTLKCNSLVHPESSIDEILIPAIVNQMQDLSVKKKERSCTDAESDEMTTATLQREIAMVATRSIKALDIYTGPLLLGTIVNTPGLIEHLGKKSYRHDFIQYKERNPLLQTQIARHLLLADSFEQVVRRLRSLKLELAPCCDPKTRTPVKRAWHVKRCRHHIATIWQYPGPIATLDWMPAEFELQNDHFTLMAYDVPIASLEFINLYTIFFNKQEDPGKLRDALELIGYEVALALPGPCYSE